MRKNDIQYFSMFLDEFQKETDRGAALVGAAMIEDRLERILLSHLLDNNVREELFNGINAPLGNFSSKVKIAYCLGLITDLEYNECEYIRKIRNEFAHSLHGLKFDDQKIKDLCFNLKANTPRGDRCGGDPRQLFINSVILTSMALFYRPEYNNPYKCKKRNWRYTLAPEKNL